MEVGLKTSSHIARVDLEFDSSRITVQDEHQLRFRNMEDVAAFSDALAGLVTGWRADEAFAALSGLRKQIADAVVAEMHHQFILAGIPHSGFPDDVLLAKEWHIDLKTDDHAIAVSIEVHVKSLIISLADAFSTAAKAGAIR